MLIIKLTICFDFQHLGYHPVFSKHQHLSWAKLYANFLCKKKPGFGFSAKTAARASPAVLDNSITLRIKLENYDLKNTNHASSAKSSAIDLSDSSPKNKGRKSLLKTKTNQSNMDGFEKPKISFFNEEGNKMIAED